ncbi:MAG: nitrate reductase molybdenum cofactor assembly chaperone [Chloroflexi bacterium]|nr:nitrate reductase molybdenum cofactor assembly chaperone [Chloroflexota bacterium]
MMAGQSDQQRLYALFADLLEYPDEGIAAAAQACAALAAEQDAAAGRLLAQFQARIARTAPGRLQEIYTGTFDMDAFRSPYVGYHLFGESYKRSVFLLELKDRYQARHIEVGSEMPDHLALLVRYLAACDDRDERDDLICWALLPVLDQLTRPQPAAQDESGEQGAEASPPPPPVSPYQNVLKALRRVLERECPPADLPEAVSQEAVTTG